MLSGETMSAGFILCKVHLIQLGTRSQRLQGSTSCQHLSDGICNATALLKQSGQAGPKVDGTHVSSVTRCNAIWDISENKYKKINNSTEGSVKVEQQYTHRFTDYNCCKLLTLSKSYKPVRTPEQRTEARLEHVAYIHPSALQSSRSPTRNAGIVISTALQRFTACTNLQLIDYWLTPAKPKRRKSWFNAILRNVRQ